MNDVVDNVKENVIEVEGDVVGQEDNNFQVIKNLSADKALVFFFS